MSGQKMTTLYLLEPQTLVKKEGDALAVHIPANEETGEPKRKRRVPLIKVERVVVQGRSTLTSEAVAALLERGSGITYLDQYGGYRGHLAPPFTKNGQLRLAQASAHLDWERRHVLARQFVRGKLHNMRTLLLRHNRTRKIDELAQSAESIKNALCALDVLPLDELPAPTGNPQAASAYGRMQGLEGSATAAYFGCFRHILKTPALFNGRTRRPPRDPANALLSYGYTILLNQVQSALCTVGFDPYIGYLHGTGYGKPALALDLMEEFRPIVVDSVMLTIFNTGELSDADFIEQLGSYRLTAKGRRTFLTRLETRFNETIKHPTFGYKATYRRCIELQARLLAKFVTDEVEEYPSFRVR